MKLLSLFKIDGKPANEVATEGQIVIFACIVFKLKPRIQILCSTQYGKSLFVALACLVLTCIYNEKVAVIAPKAEQAKIIMRYYIDHLGDNSMFSSQLEANTKLDRLRKEESKERIMLLGGGGIFVASTNEANSKKKVEAVMGQGCENVIQDESGLISNETESTIYRMIAGKGKNVCYVKIGNPFYRNHFLKSWGNGSYLRIFIDVYVGLKEGRYTQEFVDEARSKPMYDILYECKFPAEDQIDDKGYQSLTVSEDLKIMPSVDEKLGEVRLGVDVARGGDKTIFILRWDNCAEIVCELKTKDTMTIVAKTQELITLLNIDPVNVFVDVIGLGGGVVDRLFELDLPVVGVASGASPINKSRYANIRAENCWEARLWLKEGNVLLEPNVSDWRDKQAPWEQLTWFRWRSNTDKVIQINSKDDIKREHSGVSPDYADAFYLTFTQRPFVGIL